MITVCTKESLNTLTMNEVTDVDEEHGQTSSDIKVDIVVPADDDNDNQTDKTQDTNNLQVALVGDEATLGAADDNIFRGRKKPETIMEWCEVSQFNKLL